MLIDQHITDISLFERIANNEEAAFRELFHSYAPEIRPVIISITKKEEVVADIIQEIFLRIWLNRGQLSTIHSPRSWIFKIVYYQSFNWLRKQKIHEKHMDSFSFVVDQSTSTNFVLDQSSFEETRRLVKQAIQQLPPQTQKIYRLSREEGLKVTEIAEVLGLSSQTVKNTLSRALHNIKGYLEENGVIISMFIPLLFYRF